MKKTYFKTITNSTPHSITEDINNFYENGSFESFELIGQIQYVNSPQPRYMITIKVTEYVDGGTFVMYEDIHGDEIYQQFHAGEFEDKFDARNKLDLKTGSIIYSVIEKEYHLISNHGMKRVYKNDYTFVD